MDHSRDPSDGTPHADCDDFAVARSGHPGDGVLRIDCDDCAMQGTECCADCLVTFICSREPGGGGGGRCRGGAGAPHAVRRGLASGVAPHPPHGLSHGRALATVPGLPGDGVTGTMARCPWPSFTRLGASPTSPTWWRWGVRTGSTRSASLRPGRSPPRAATSSADVPRACTRAWRSPTGAPIGRPIRGERCPGLVRSWSAPAAIGGRPRRHPQPTGDHHESSGSMRPTVPRGRAALRLGGPLRPTAVGASGRRS